jgi:EmrB/QacA subfamily drug resistance transporter
MSAATVVLTIDLFGVNVALPTIAADLDLSNAALQWVVSIYYLALAAPLIAAGRIGDILGRRRMLLVGAALASIGSLTAALAPDGAVLIAARGVSGVGAAFVTALSLSIVSDAFPAARRGIAIGIWSAVGAIGAAAGPLVGGVVTETLGWRWLFAIDVPVALAAMVVTVLVVRESRDPGAHGVDLAGVVLATVGLGLLSFGLLQGPDAGWGSPGVVLAFIGAAAGLAAFVVVELRVAEPLVDLGWLRRPPASGTGAVALAGNAAFATVMLYLTLYFQGVRGDGPIETGIAFLAFTIPMALGSPLAGTLATHAPVRLTMAGGLVLVLGGAACFATITVESDATLAYLGLALSGVGQAIVFNVTNIADVSSVSRARSGMAAGVVSGVRQIGSLLGLAVAGAAFAAAGGTVLASGAIGGSAAGFVDGLRAAMIVTIVFCVAGLAAVPWARTTSAGVAAPAS